MRNIYIDGLKDPRDGKLRYVGQTVNLTARMASHAFYGQIKSHPTKREPRRMSRKDLWLRDLNRAGLAAEVVLLETCTERRADAVESKWIERATKGGDVVNFYRCKVERARRPDADLIGVAAKVTSEERGEIGKALRRLNVTLRTFLHDAAMEKVARVNGTDAV